MCYNESRETVGKERPMEIKTTPHIVPKNGTHFAKTVLMPGDPLRAKYIAENFLTTPVLVNDVRGMLGYSGFWENKEISVMASGMGAPSMGIYSYELFRFFNVENIIRIGSAGGIRKDLKVRDILAAQGSCTNSAYPDQYLLPGTFAPIASYLLLKTADRTAQEMGIDLKIGNVLTSDTFYDDGRDTMTWETMGVLATEMETAALYCNAARLRKNALSLLTISDCLFAPEIQLTAEERQTTMNEMILLALNTATKLND